MTQIAETPKTDGRSRLRAMLPTLLLDIALPTGAYYVLSSLGMSDVYALTIGGLLSGLRVLYTVIRTRKVDGFAALVLGGFVLSIGLVFVTGDPRFVLAKDSFGTGVAGLYMLATCLIGKPFMFAAALRFRASGNPELGEQMRNLYQNSAPYRRTMRGLTLMWGCGLLVESAVRLVLVYLLPVPTVVSVSPVLMIATIGLLMVITIRIVRRAIATKQAQSALR